MASVLKGKIKVLPSGLASVLVSHVPASPTWQSCQSSAELETGTTERTRESDQGEVRFKSGYGGLGRKSSASWKTCRGASERMAACEMEYGLGNLWFLTLTQPSTDPLAFEGLARWSAYAMDRLNRVLNRYFGEREFARVSVWEYQERGSLHLHILISSDCIHALDIEEFRHHVARFWFSILRDIGRKFNCNSFLSSWGETWSFESLMKNRDGRPFADCQVVHSSVVAYLSSYLADSNHGKNKKDKNKIREKFYPIATWMQWNKKATSLMNKFTDSFELGVCEPDKLPMIRKKIEAVKEELCIKDGTKFIHPNNPYNHGFYMIPDPSKIQENASVLAELVGDLSYHFREKMFDDRVVSFQRENEDDSPEPQGGLMLELRIRILERRERIKKSSSEIHRTLTLRKTPRRLMTNAEIRATMEESCYTSKYTQLGIEYDTA